jgi:hypothetical protein
MKISTPALLALGITCFAVPVAMLVVQIAGVSFLLWENPLPRVSTGEFVRLLITRPITLVPILAGALFIVGAAVNAVLTKCNSHE